MDAPTDRSRRRLLQCAAQAALGTFGAYATLGSLHGLGLSAAHAQNAATGYRALVCVFLFGGNDSLNLLVPRDMAGYDIYAAGRRNLALAREALLPITPQGGGDYGLHPNAAGLRDLFAAGRLAFVANVGSLVAPVTKADVIAKVDLPRELLSHNEQTTQWMLGQPESFGTQGGWAGRLADLMMTPSPDGLVMNVSIAGNNLLQTGSSSAPYTMAATGPVSFEFGDDAERIAHVAALRQQAIAGPSPLAAYFGAMAKGAAEFVPRVRSALKDARPLGTVFPETQLGSQLRAVARLMQSRIALGSPSRQIFFVSLGGFDTHDLHLSRHAALMAELSAALAAFDAAVTELGLSETVTTFTHSEFGRTLTSNGDGTDHAWGSHQIVVGGAVRGGRIHGTLPDLTLGGPDDMADGRFIPTVAVDQYVATLGKWFGASTTELATVFPNLDRFTKADVGFMN